MSNHKMADQILNLTLEVIYLLTGEDCTVVKKSGECLASRSHPRESEGWDEDQSPAMMPSSPSMTGPEDNEQKILEVVNKILQMLSGEVPIRCQDVTVHLSMEEWEYLEGHKDQYKEVMMEDQRPLTPQDGPSRSITPESCPSPPSLDDDGDKNELAEHLNVKAEKTEGDEEYYRGDLPCKEEDTPTYIRTEALLSLQCTPPPPPSSDCDIEYYTRRNIFGEHLSTSKLPLAINSRDFSADPHTLEGTSSDQSQTVKQPFGFDATNHSDEEQFSCLEFGKCFTDETSLLDHQRVHTEENPYSCLKCGKCFTDEISLLDHQRVHTEENPYSCLKCGKCFAIKTNLDEHQKIHSEEKPFSCLECGKRFNRRADLMTHHRIHSGERPFSCIFCGKCFRKKLHLVKHERLHTGEKPFTCSNCGKCFRLRNNLYIHQRIHTGERPFSCPDCDKSFTQKSDLVVHKRSHTGEKPYACPECGKCYTRKRSLVEHKRIHTGEKPFSCTECGRCFNQKRALDVHKKIHTKEAPYLCSECGKRFNQKQALTVHQRKHTGERPYSCAEYGQPFMQ